MLNGKVVTRVIGVWDVTRDDKKNFRIEIHEHEDDSAMHVVEYIVKVYKLSYPIVLPPVGQKQQMAASFIKFPQHWTLVENFPSVSTEGMPNEIRDRAIAEILKLQNQ